MTKQKITLKAHDYKLLARKNKRVLSDKSITIAKTHLAKMRALFSENECNGKG